MRIWQIYYQIDLFGMVFNKKGFTLIEMVMYVAVILIAASVVGSFVPQLTRSHSYLQSKADSLESAYRAIDLISREINNSVSIYTPTSVFDTNPGQLSLAQLSDDVSETYTFIDFFVDGGKLYLKREGVEPLLLMSQKIEVENLTFTHLNPNSTNQAIRISLTVSHETASPTLQYQSRITLTSTASLRSY